MKYKWTTDIFKMLSMTRNASKKCKVKLCWDSIFSSQNGNVKTNKMREGKEAGKEEPYTLLVDM